MSQDTDVAPESDEVVGKDPADLVLAYFSCPKDGASDYLGALLITDARARPLHFSHVSPVRPSKIQRVLYGATLREHVIVDVIAQTLLSKSIRTVPDVLFVDDSNLLVVQRITDIPAAHLSASKTDNAGASLSVVRYETAGIRNADEIVGRIVAALEQHIDLLEPFKRVREALKETLAK